MSTTGAFTAKPAPGSSRAYLDLLERRRDDVRAQLSPILPGSLPFTWEVGCGHGHFLTAYAQSHPDKLCIGIDIVGERIERAVRKRDRAQLANLFFVQAEARLFLDALPASARFSELFILFPDPWPKIRHRKHRILQSGFLTQAAARSVVSSRILFRTDHGAYFEDAQRVLQTHSRWRVSPEEWPFEYCTVFQSRAAVFHSLIARRFPGPGFL